MEMDVEKINIKTEFYIYYLNQKQNGMSYAQIRSELSIHDLSDTEINSLIRGIDNEVLRLLKLKERNRKANGTIFFGSFILLVGIILMSGILPFAMEVFKHTVLPLTLIGAGLSTILFGIAQKRKLR